MLKSIALVAIAALSLAACSKKEAPINDENEIITLKFNIKNVDDASTRALLATDANGKKFLNWEDADKIGTFSVGSFPNDQTTSNNNAGTVVVSGDNYTLNVQTFNAGTVTNIYSYFPYSAAAGKDKTAASVSIPGSQYMNAEGFDADAMPMAGTPVSVDLTTTANTDTPCGTINFFNLGSIINFKIYSSTDTDETLTSVKYVAGTGNLGGSYTIDLTAVDGSDETTLALGGDGSESEITTTHRASPSIGTGKANAIDVYMVVAPGTYSGTQVVVTTSARTYTLNASGAKTYTRSSVKPMYVDIQKGTAGDLPQEETWTKVTSASDFTAGTYYILRADGAGYVSNAKATSAPPVFVSYTAGDPITADMRWTATVSGNGLVFESAANEGFTLGSSNIDGKANTTRVTDSYSGTSAKNVWSFAVITVSENTYYTATLGSSKYLVSYGTSDWRYYATSNINASNIPAEFYKLDVVDDTPRFTVESPLAATALEDTYTVNVSRSNFTGAITVTVPSECDWVAADDVAENATSFDILVDANTGAARSVTLTLSATGVDSQELVINQAGNDPGTASNPYTVSEAISAAGQLASGAQSDAEVFISGIVSTVESFNSTYKSITYYISDDGTTTNQFEVYSGKGLNGADFASISDLAVGDQVTVKGYLKNFNGTLEVNQSSQIVAITYATRYTITLDAGSNGALSSSATSTSAQSSVTITITPDSGYELDVLTVDGTDVTSSVVADAYSFLMPAKNITVSATFKTATTSSESVDFTAQGYTNQQAVSSYTGTNFSIAFDKGTNSSNGPKYYTSGTAIRVYGGNTITVSSTTKTISKIEVTFGSSDGTNAISTDVGTYNNGTWTGSSSSIVFTIGGTSGNRRIAGFKVYF